MNNRKSFRQRVSIQEMYLCQMLTGEWIVKEQLGLVGTSLTYKIIRFRSCILKIPSINFIKWVHSTIYTPRNVILN